MIVFYSLPPVLEGKIVIPFWFHGTISNIPLHPHPPIHIHMEEMRSWNYIPSCKPHNPIWGVQTFEPRHRGFRYARSAPRFLLKRLTKSKVRWYIYNYMYSYIYMYIYIYIYIWLWYICIYICIYIYSILRHVCWNLFRPFLIPTSSTRVDKKCPPRASYCWVDLWWVHWNKKTAIKN